MLQDGETDHVFGGYTQDGTKVCNKMRDTGQVFGGYTQHGTKVCNKMGKQATSVVATSTILVIETEIGLT